MTAALMALITALFLGLPFSTADVRDAGISVTVRESLADRHPAAIGWTWCGGPECRIEVTPDTPAFALRHEVCHSISWLADGKADGQINGWQPWLGDHEAETGRYDNDEERLGYWCGRQPVDGIAS